MITNDKNKNKDKKTKSKKIAILTDDAQLEKELFLLLSQNNFICAIAKDESSLDCDLVITDKAEFSQKTGALSVDRPVFSHALLLERINNAIENDSSDTLELDLAASPCVRIGARNIKLTKNEAAILDLLLSNRGKAVSADDLLCAIGADRKKGSNEAAVYIRYLRKKLENASASCAVKTVRGKGYMLK